MRKKDLVKENEKLKQIIKTYNSINVGNINEKIIFADESYFLKRLF